MSLWPYKLSMSKLEAVLPRLGVEAIAAAFCLVIAVSPLSLSFHPCGVAVKTLTSGCAEDGWRVCVPSSRGASGVWHVCTPSLSLSHLGP